MMSFCNSAVCVGSTFQSSLCSTQMHFTSAIRKLLHMLTFVILMRSLALSYHTDFTSVEQKPRFN